MPFDVPVVIDEVPVSGLEWRRMQAALLGHDTHAIAAKPGVLHGLAVTISGLTVTIDPGSAVLSPHTASNGAYFAVTADVVAVSAAAQDATYARIDRVVLRVYDTAVDGSGYSKAEISIVSGTPSATPATPALPTGALELAQLQVPKAGTAITVVDQRQWVGTIGAPIVVTSVANLPAGVYLRLGQVAWVADASTMWAWSGSEWLLIGKPRFASAAQRDAAIPAPKSGYECWVGTTPYVYLGGWAVKYATQAQSAVVTPSSYSAGPPVVLAGRATIAYPTPWPTRAESVTVSVGDVASDAQSVRVVGFDPANKANFLVEVKNSSGALVTTPCRINWIASGY